MNPMVKRLTLIVGSIVVGGAVGIVIAVASNHGRASATQQPANPGEMVKVQVGTTTDSASQSASTLAGLELVAPTYVPPGDAVEWIGVWPDTAAQALRVAEIAVRGPDGGLVLTETNRADQILNSAEPIQWAGAAKIWRQANSFGFTYTALEAGRSYSVFVRPQSKVSETEALHVLESTVK